MRVGKQWRGFILLEMAMLYFLEMVLLLLASDLVAFGQNDAAQFGISMLICCGMAVAMLLVFHTGKWGITTLGFYRRNMRKQLLLILPITAILFVLTAVISTCFTLLHLPRGSGIIASFPLHSRELTSFTAYRSCYLFFFGIVQELIFRGYYYSRIKMLTKLSWLPMIGAALLYTLFQFPFYPHIVDLLCFLLIGLFLGTCRLKLHNCSLLTVSLSGGLYSLLSYLI
jgi:hypothetical protein